MDYHFYYSSKARFTKITNFSNLPLIILRSIKITTEREIFLLESIKPISWTSYQDYPVVEHPKDNRNDDVGPKYSRARA